MNCTEARHAIDQLSPQDLPQGAVKAHLASCELCQQYYGERMLERKLEELQVPEPSAEFLERAMQRAAQQAQAREGASRRATWRWPSALAASALIVGGVFFALQEAPAPGDVNQVAETQTEQPSYHREEVRVVIRSQGEWENAEVTVELAENLELEGFSGEHEISWNTRLSKGSNMLTLPILVRDNGGEVRVRSNYGGQTHEVQLRVAPKDQSSTLSTG
jgi:hypothetical protein